MLPIASIFQLHMLVDAFSPVMPGTALVRNSKTTKTTIPATLRMKKMSESENNDEQIDNPSPVKKDTTGSLGKLAGAAALATALTINPLPSEAVMSGGRLGGNYYSAPPPPVIERPAPRFRPGAGQEPYPDHDRQGHG